MCSCINVGSCVQEGEEVEEEGGGEAHVEEVTSMEDIRVDTTRPDVITVFSPSTVPGQAGAQQSLVSNTDHRSYVKPPTPWIKQTVPVSSFTGSVNINTVSSSQKPLAVLLDLVIVFSGFAKQQFSKVEKGILFTFKSFWSWKKECTFYFSSVIVIYKCYLKSVELKTIHLTTGNNLMYK